MYPSMPVTLVEHPDSRTPSTSSLYPPRSRSPSPQRSVRRPRSKGSKRRNRRYRPSDTDRPSITHGGQTRSRSHSPTHRAGRQRPIVRRGSNTILQIPHHTNQLPDLGYPHSPPSQKRRADLSGKSQDQPYPSEPSYERTYDIPPISRSSSSSSHQSRHRSLTFDSPTHRSSRFPGLMRLTVEPPSSPRPFDSELEALSPCCQSLPSCAGDEDI
ncbi:hypothetical protein FA13DRAFT_377853 [Coprinellus micaceus]|uniref:Uncharacterized protein n=1 Tax=Coprinellus micaceus TaxID=71717 RepID=A0A4Y7SCD8_COPMI|nr:hypothetical protein FA13DRAFT_377853 [Coprinellus micaceus]